MAQILPQGLMSKLNYGITRQTIMAYITTENLRPGMVVARRLLDQNQRVLLQAGIALGRSHIQALRSLGIAGVEIRGSFRHSPAPPPADSPLSYQPRKKKVLSFPYEQYVISRSSAAPAVSQKPLPDILRVTRAATRPLRPKPEPLVAKQSAIILNRLLKGTGIKENSAVASVIKLCAIRVLQAKCAKKQASKHN